MSKQKHIRKLAKFTEATEEKNKVTAKVKTPSQEERRDAAKCSKKETLQSGAKVFLAVIQIKKY